MQPIEHLITLADDDAPYTAKGVVRTVTPYFAERYLLLEVYGNGEYWTMHAPPDAQIRPKDVVTCAIAPEQLLFFDPDTDLRIG